MSANNTSHENITFEKSSSYLEIILQHRVIIHSIYIYLSNTILSTEVILNEFSSISMFISSFITPQR